MNQPLENSAKVAALYKAVGPAIYARCCRLLKDRAAAEDATQEVFIKVFKAAESRPCDGALIGWVHRVTTNYCLNMIRDAHRRAEPMAPEDLPEVHADDFESQLIARDFAERLFDEQPDTLKGPATLYHVEGIEQAEVAQQLGVSRRTVLYRLAEFVKRARCFELAEATA